MKEFLPKTKPPDDVTNQPGRRASFQSPVTWTPAVEVPLWHHADNGEPFWPLGAQDIHQLSANNKFPRWPLSNLAGSVLGGGGKKPALLSPVLGKNKVKCFILVLQPRESQP